MHTCAQLSFLPLASLGSPCLGNGAISSGGGMPIKIIKITSPQLCQEAISQESLGFVKCQSQDSFLWS